MIISVNLIIGSHMIVSPIITNFAYIYTLATTGNGSYEKGDKDQDKER